MKKKQIKKLLILEELIPKCHKCKICKNGMAIPFWTPKSKYAMIAEAPGREEVKEDKQTPLVGDSGKLTFKTFKKYGILREHFLIINTIQCRPVKANGSNGKPTSEEILRCRFWVDKYLKVFDPKYMIVFGGYAVSEILGITSGITSFSGQKFKRKDRIIVPCIHPASVLYHKEENKPIFNRSIKAFAEVIKNV